MSDRVDQIAPATHARVLANLRRHGRVFARNARLQGAKGGTATRATLQAIVDAGDAKWDVVVLGGYAFDIVVEAHAGPDRQPHALTEEDLESIRVRVEAGSKTPAAKDRAVLFAEVLRLREGLNAMSENWRREWCHARDADDAPFDPGTITAIREDLQAVIGAVDVDDRSVSLATSGVTETVDCNCGFGGVHDDVNPRCAKNQTGGVA